MIYSYENRKIEVAQRHLDSEARLQEREEERLKKVSDIAALQEAVSERRRAQELDRLAKIAREEEKKKEYEAKRELERKDRLATKAARKEEKVYLLIKIVVGDT
jgi:hypothetical protein